MTTPSNCTVCGLPIIHGKCPYCSTASARPDNSATPPAELVRELEKLRVSLARIAQKLGVDAIPGCMVTADFTELSAAAYTQQRGWNALGARIMDSIQETQDKLLSEQAELRSCRYQINQLNDRVYRINRDREQLLDEIEDLEAALPSDD